jgi:hypothetical protein
LSRSAVRIDGNESVTTLTPLQIPTLFAHECHALDNRFQGRRRRTGVVGIAVFVTLLALLCESVLRYVPSGGLLFKGLFVPATIALLLFGRGLGVRLAEHRRNQMLGLVFLAGVKPRSLFLAQIGARIVAAIYLGLALLPCLAISILYGGASKERCIAAAIFIVLEIVFLIALEFLGPALTADPAGAGLITTVVTAVLSVWPWIIDRLSLLISGVGLPAWVYFFSPLNAFFQILRDFRNAAEFYDFLLNCLIVSAIAANVLLFSAWTLQHVWREEEHPLLRFKVFRRLLHMASHWQRDWAKIIRPQLEENPLLWHAAYELRFVRYAWITVVVVMALWLAGLVAWGMDWLVAEIFYIATATLIYGVRLQIILRAATRFSESRHNDYFDAILAANSAPDLIVAAEHKAIYLQFAGVKWVVRAITLMFMLAPIPLRHWTTVTLFEHLVLGGTLLWASRLRPHMAITRAIWIALNTGAGVSSVFRRSSLPLAQFGFQFYRIIQHGVVNLSRFPTGEPMEALLILVGCPIIVIIVVASQSEYPHLQTKTATYFREILQAPIRTAKEIAKWDTKEPLL